jgi:hypothetical protein
LWVCSLGRRRKVRSCSSAARSAGQRRRLHGSTILDMRDIGSIVRRKCARGGPYCRVSMRPRRERSWAGTLVRLDVGRLHSPLGPSVRRCVPSRSDPARARSACGWRCRVSRRWNRACPDFGLIQSAQWVHQLPGRDSAVASHCSASAPTFPPVQ